jgi:hypothetical protein
VQRCYAVNNNLMRDKNTHKHMNKYYVLILLWPESVGILKLVLILNFCTCHIWRSAGSRMMWSPAHSIFVVEHEEEEIMREPINVWSHFYRRCGGDAVTYKIMTYDVFQ